MVPADTGACLELAFNSANCSNNNTHIPPYTFTKIYKFCTILTNHFIWTVYYHTNILELFTFSVTFIFLSV